MRPVNGIRVDARILCLLALLGGATGCKVDFDAIEDSVREARRGLSTYEWRDGDDSLKASVKGKITFSEDESDVATLEPDGFLKIEQRGAQRWTYDAVPLPNGDLKRSFARDGQTLSPGPATDQWLREILPKILRQTGIDAPGRVRRLLSSGGPDAFLAEIEQIQTSSVQRLYIDEFLSQEDPTAEQTRRLARVAVQTRSSSESERIVEQLVDRHGKDAELTDLLIQASAQVRSSSGKVRMTDFILTHREIGEAAALKIAASLAEIRTSTEKANGLVALADASPGSAPVRLALLDAVGTISSSSEKGRALMSIVETSVLDRQIAVRAAEVIKTVRSDSERARALRQLVAEMPLDPEILEPVLGAARRLSTSSKEQTVMALIRREYGRSELETILQFVRDNLPEGSISTRLQQRIERQLEGIS